jgi:hypothetical protein
VGRGNGTRNHVVFREAIEYIMWLQRRVMELERMIRELEARGTPGQED